MTLNKLLLGTTALVGVGMFYAGEVRAADLNVDVEAVLRFGVAVGDLEDALGTSNLRDYDFYTDNEIHFVALATDDETGISYGGTVELEAGGNAGEITATADEATGAIQDVSAGSTIDESFLFLRGGFGEFQLGDQDSASDQLKTGAYSIAAGTGGIDGDSYVTTVAITIPNSGDATKITYLSPTEALYGFTVGASFTPDEGSQGTDTADNDSGNLENMVELGAQYALSLAGFDVALGATGIIAQGEPGVDDVEGYSVGASTGVFGLQVAGSYFDANNFGDGWNVGVGGTFGPADASVTYGTSDLDGTDDEAESLVFSASVGMLPGVVLQGDVALFTNVTGDDGIAGVTRLDINF